MQGAAQSTGHSSGKENAADEATASAAGACIAVHVSQTEGGLHRLSGPQQYLLPGQPSSFIRLAHLACDPSATVASRVSHPHSSDWHTLHAMCQASAILACRSGVSNIGLQVIHPQPSSFQSTHNYGCTLRATCDAASEGLLGRGQGEKHTLDASDDGFGSFNLELHGERIHHCVAMTCAVSDLYPLERLLCHRSHHLLVVASQAASFYAQSQLAGLLSPWAQICGLSMQPSIALIALPPRDTLVSAPALHTVNKLLVNGMESKVLDNCH